MLKTPLKFLITIVLTLGLSMSFQSLLASWTAPTAIPPNNNVTEPINAGDGEQTKIGLLKLLDGLSVASTTILDGELFISSTINSLGGDLMLSGGNNGMEFNIDSDGVGSDRYVFKINGTEVMRLNNNGDLYISSNKVTTNQDLSDSYYTKTEVNDLIANIVSGNATGDTYVVPGLTCPGGDIAIEYEHISKACTGTQATQFLGGEISMTQDCYGATNCTTGDSGGWTTSPTPYTCAYKSEYEYSIAFSSSSGCGLSNSTCTSTGNVKCMDPDNIPLYNSLHTVGQCETNGGTVVDVGGDKFCKFNGDSCAPGFIHHPNLTKTTAKTCSGYTCDYNGISCQALFTSTSNCPGSDGAGLTSTLSQCTTSSHAFSVNTRESCTYLGNSITGVEECGDGPCRTTYTCAYTNTTCQANIVEVGCY